MIPVPLRAASGPSISASPVAYPRAAMPNTVTSVVIWGQYFIDWGLRAKFRS